MYKKLEKVKAELEAISKDSKNPFFKSAYFDINQLLKHVEPIIQKHGLVLLQPIKNGIVSSIIHDNETDDFVSSELELPKLDDPQKLGSCITYYRRYTLQSLLALQAEDDDGNKTTQNKDTQTRGAVPLQVGKKFPDKWLNIKDQQGNATREWKNLLNSIKEAKITTLKQVTDVYKVSKVNQELILKELNNE